MNCPEVREAFSDLYDGALSGTSLADVGRHLDDCPACRAEWEAFRRAMEALNGLADEEPSRDFAARVMARIEAPRWWQRAAAALLLPLRVKLPIHAAALVLLGLAGLWVSQRSPELRRATVGHAPPAAERAAPAREEASPAAPPPAAHKAGADLRPPPPSPKMAAPQKSESPAAGGRKAEGPPPATQSKDAAQEPPVQQEAARPMAAPPAPALPQAQGEIAPPGRLQAAPSAPDAREKTDSGPRAEPGASVTQRSMSAPARRPADDLFSSAVTEYAARRYDPAIDDLRAFLAQRPGDPRAPDARFLLADAYRAQGRDAEADAEFGAFLRQYPQHPKAPVALYRHGEIRLRLGDPTGCSILRDALSRYPDAPEAAGARETVSARCP